MCNYAATTRDEFAFHIRSAHIRHHTATAEGGGNQVPDQMPGSVKPANNVAVTGEGEESGSGKRPEKIAKFDHALSGASCTSNNIEDGGTINPTKVCNVNNDIIMKRNTKNVRILKNP